MQLLHELGVQLLARSPALRLLGHPDGGDDGEGGRPQRRFASVHGFFRGDAHGGDENEILSVAVQKGIKVSALNV